MDSMERTLTVAVLIGMLVMIFMLSGKTEDLEDRVEILEQVEETRTNRQNIDGARHEEQVSKYSIGMGMAGDMSHYLDSSVSHGGNGMINTTGKVYGIGGCYSKGTARSYYHISDPVCR